MANYLPGPCVPFAFLLRAFRAPFAKIHSATSAREAISLMDSDTDDEQQYCTGSTSVPSWTCHIAASARACLFGKLGRESQNNTVKKKLYACATVQQCHAAREVAGTDF